MKIIINKPIWKDKSVGIKIDNITEDIEVEILYTDKKGNKTFPHTYVMAKKKALQYPSRAYGNTPTLQIIPIADFKIEVPVVLTEDERAKQEYFKSQGLNY